MTESGERSALPWAGLAVLLMGGYFYWSGQAPLKSSRPVLEGLPSAPEIAKNSVLARLWEDPLVPAQREYEARTGREAPPPRKAESGEGRPDRTEKPEKPESRRQQTLDVIENEQRAFVQKHLQSQAKKSASVEAVAQTPKARTLILPVFLDSQPYSESTESRIRCRYAVVSALGATGFVPKESDRIRYWVSRPSGKSSEFLVPFE